MNRFNVLVFGSWEFKKVSKYFEIISRTNERLVSLRVDTFNHLNILSIIFYFKVHSKVFKRRKIQLIMISLLMKFCIHFTFFCFFTRSGDWLVRSLFEGSLVQDYISKNLPETICLEGNWFFFMQVFCPDATTDMFPPIFTLFTKQEDKILFYYSWNCFIRKCYHNLQKKLFKKTKTSPFTRAYDSDHLSNLPHSSLTLQDNLHILLWLIHL